MSNFIEDFSAKADSLVEGMITKVYELLVDGAEVIVLHDLDDTKHVWISFENAADQTLFDSLVNKAVDGNSMCREVVERFKVAVENKVDTM